MQSLSKTGATAIQGAQVIRALIAVPGFTGSHRAKWTGPLKREEGAVKWNLSSARATFSEDTVRWETATVTRKAPGLVPACWVDGGAKQSGNAHAVTGRAFSCVQAMFLKSLGSDWHLFWHCFFSASCWSWREPGEWQIACVLCCTSWSVRPQICWEMKGNLWAKSHFCSVWNSQIRVPSVSPGRQEPVHLHLFFRTVWAKWASQVRFWPADSTAPVTWNYDRIRLRVSVVWHLRCISPEALNFPYRGTQTTHLLVLAN